VRGIALSPFLSLTRPSGFYEGAARSRDRFEYRVVGTAFPIRALASPLPREKPKNARQHLSNKSAEFTTGREEMVATGGER
jgi:hypothetical protein